MELLINRPAHQELLYLARSPSHKNRFSRQAPGHSGVLLDRDHVTALYGVSIMMMMRSCNYSYLLDGIARNSEVPANSCLLWSSPLSTSGVFVLLLHTRLIRRMSPQSYFMYVSRGSHLHQTRSSSYPGTWAKFTRVSKCPGFLSRPLGYLDHLLGLI